MITSLTGTKFDQLQRSAAQSPAYRVLLFSRWQDTDNDIVRGSYLQQPIDLTQWVVDAQLTLASGTDASSLSLSISVEKLTLNIFANCIVQLQEGEASIDPAVWPVTFTGWRLGQPGSTESAFDGLPTPEQGRGERGAERTISLQFHSRERLFTDTEITSDGVWYPNAKEQSEPQFQYRNSYDNIGDISREVCTNQDWGLGLTNDECLIGKQPYRIEKQLQFVQISPWEALQQLLEVMQTFPRVNGEGKIVSVSRELTKPTARTVDGSVVIAISQPDAAFNQVNAVIARGLSKDLSVVKKADQRLTTLDGTFGFFDPEVLIKDTWSNDKQDSWQVMVGTGADGNGKTVTSPRIRNFQNEGFIETVSDPKFIKKNNFNYEVSIENDTLAVIGLIAALIGGYVAAQTAVVLLTPASTVPPAPTVINPGAVAAQTGASLLLVGGIWVLQQIGNFSFEIWGVPFETVYEEIRVDANLGHFATRSGSSPFREFEQKPVEVTNYLLSSEDDSIVPAKGTEPQITNPGVRTFAVKELGIRLAEQATRQIRMVRDVLLEPGDVIKHSLDGQRYFLKSISRTLSRAGDSAPVQDCEAFLMPSI